MMAFTDPSISGSRFRLRRSSTPGEVPATQELRLGELAINAADGVMYVGKNDNTAGVIPGATGVRKIVALTQAAYDALATKDEQTLYVIT
jgi:hypothetical protein